MANSDEDFELAVAMPMEVNQMNGRNSPTNEPDYLYALHLQQEIDKCREAMECEADWKNSSITECNDYQYASKLQKEIDECKEAMESESNWKNSEGSSFQMEFNDYQYALQLQKEIDECKEAMESESNWKNSEGSSFQMEFNDYQYALQLQKEMDECKKAMESEADWKSPPSETAQMIVQPKSLIDPILESLDPTPNIYKLFQEYDQRFFKGKLAGVEIKWSPRMTLCAGICSYSPRQGHCCVKLSKPLLKLRPRKDLVETMLHEMIHAYLFVTRNNRDRDGHGPEFHKHMYRINAEGGTHITVYHSFHDEVRSYKVHWWKCQGPCSGKPPFYGMVKRSMNRAPGPNDIWWDQHEAICGGNFVKIREPEGYAKKKAHKVKKDDKSATGMDAYLKKLGSGSTLSGSTPSSRESSSSFQGSSSSSTSNAALPRFPNRHSAVPRGNSLSGPTRGGHPRPRFGFGGNVGMRNNGASTITTTGSVKDGADKGKGIIKIGANIHGFRDL